MNRSGIILAQTHQLGSGHISPRIHKNGDFLPLFKVNSPNLSTSLSTINSINSCLYCSILSISSCYPKPSFVFILFYSTIKKGEPQCVPVAFGLPVGVKILADSIIMCPHSNYFHGSIIPHPFPFHWLTIHLINQPVLNIDSSRINSLQISNQRFIGWWILKRGFPDDLYQLFRLIIKSGTLQILNIFYCLLIIYNSVHRSTILHLPLAHNLLTAYPSRFL